MRHPKGTGARVLLSSVFKPFAQDDEYGSRTINPVELYHNQVTREQGPFSLRMFHRSWGLMFIHQNISAPSTLLDFPTREEFVRELQSHDYDIVGISSIVVNVGKVREMCRLVRQHSPRSTIVVGGHVTSTPRLESLIDADHIGLEHHTPENIGPETERAIAHDTVFHQFMLYTPMPGTALHAQIEADGRLLPDVDWADIHGQYKFNFRHDAITRDQSKAFLDRASARPPPASHARSSSAAMHRPCHSNAVESSACRRRHDSSIATTERP